MACMMPAALATVRTRLVGSTTCKSIRILLELMWTDLDANIIPYVVFGNECDETCPGGHTTLDATAHGIRPLSVGLYFATTNWYEVHGLCLPFLDID